MEVWLVRWVFVTSISHIRRVLHLYESMVTLLNYEVRTEGKWGENGFARSSGVSAMSECAECTLTWHGVLRVCFFPIPFCRSWGSSFGARVCMCVCVSAICLWSAYGNVVSCLWKVSLVVLRYAGLGWVIVWCVLALYAPRARRWWLVTRYARSLRHHPFYIVTQTHTDRRSLVHVLYYYYNTAQRKRCDWTCITSV